MKEKYNLIDWFYDEKNYHPNEKSGNYFDENKRPNFVYLIGNPLNLTFKIGISDNYKSRIRNLVTSSGCPFIQFLVIELHSEYDESSKYIERKLHEYFKDKRTTGEWFVLTVKDLIQIRNLFYKIEGEDIIDDLSEMLSVFYDHEKYLPKCYKKTIKF